MPCTSVPVIAFISSQEQCNPTITSTLLSRSRATHVSPFLQLKSRAKKQCADYGMSYKSKKIKITVTQ